MSDANLTKSNETKEVELKPTEPILLSVDDDLGVAIIHFVDGRKYKLQHPGNRKALQWRQKSVSLTDGITQDTLLDNFFQFCVIPEGHDIQPNLDKIRPNEVEVWLRICNRFLRGELEQ